MNMMTELEHGNSEQLNLAQYWAIAKRFRWRFAIPAFVVFAGVWMVSWFLPAVYRSETLILVEQQKVPEQYVVSNVAADLQDRLQSMTQQILSRTRLLHIIEQLNLYATERTRVSTDEIVERMRKDIQIELVQSPGRTELTAFKIAYLARDPHTAQEVTNELSSLFIEENLRVRQEQAENTTKFLDSQLEEARQSLSAQEEKVKLFKSQFLGTLPGQMQSNVQILSGLQMRLQQEMEGVAHADQQRVYLESLLNQYRSLQGGGQTNKGGAVQVPPAIDQELARLRAQLADLSSHYTERHPDIRKLKEQIAKAEAMKEQMAAQLANGGDKSTDTAAVVAYGDPQSSTPLIELQSQLKMNRLEMENRKKNVQQVQKEIDEYQSRLNAAPLREQQLTDLTRDYDQSRKNYEALLAKRDQSEMATNLEKRQQGEQFRVLDPPNLPQKPFSPNRLKLDMIGLFGGIALGGVFVVGSNMLDNRVHNKEALKEIIDVPVLTEVPPVATISELKKIRRQTWMQAAALSFMVMLLAAGFVSSFLAG
jgi:polysaccharide biosynthesis transport protein